MKRREFLLSSLAATPRPKAALKDQPPNILVLCSDEPQGAVRLQCHAEGGILDSPSDGRYEKGQRQADLEQVH